MDRSRSQGLEYIPKGVGEACDYLRKESEGIIYPCRATTNVLLTCADLVFVRLNTVKPLAGGVILDFSVTGSGPNDRGGLEFQQ